MLGIKVFILFLLLLMGRREALLEASGSKSYRRPYQEKPIGRLSFYIEFIHFHILLFALVN